MASQCTEDHVLSYLQRNVLHDVSGVYSAMEDLQITLKDMLDGVIGDRSA